MKGKSVLIKTILVGSITLLAAIECLAQENYYRWTDAQGVVHYGSRPPDNEEAVKINTFGKSKGTQINQGSQEVSDKQDPVEQTKKTMQDQRAQQCEDERKRLSLLSNSGSRIKMQQADGSTRYLSPDDLAKEIAASREFIDQACK